MDDFQFTTKKMGNSGSLFDIDKLKDVSKNTISVMSADEVYNEVTGWAKDYDQQLYTLLTGDEQKAKAIFAIGRGGAKPRKDIASGARSRTTLPSSTTSCMDSRPPRTRKMSPRRTPSPSSPSTRASTPLRMTATPWFNKVRELGETLGFAAKPKDYKKNPDQFKGHVGDVSQVIRLAITGRTNSPDLCSVMQILGEATCQQRLDEAIATLSK